MNIDFTEQEIVFLYGRIKNELLSIKNQKIVNCSKSDLKFYENLISKLEEAYPALTRLPF